MAIRFDPITGNIYGIQQPQQAQITPQQPGPGLLQSILQSVIETPKAIGRNIGATGASLAALGLQQFAPTRKIPFGGGYTGSELAQALGQGIEEQFPEAGVSRAARGETAGAVADVLKQAGYAASYAVPFGHGANILTKYTLPGITAAALQEQARTGATPKSTILAGGAGGVTSTIAGPLLQKILGGKEAKISGEELKRLQKTKFPTTPEEAMALAKSIKPVQQGGVVELLPEERAAGMTDELVNKIRTGGVKSLAQD